MLTLAKSLSPASVISALITLTEVMLLLPVLILQRNVHNPKYSDDFRSSMYHCNLCRSCPQHYHSQRRICRNIHFPVLVKNFLAVGQKINGMKVISGLAICSWILIVTNNGDYTHYTLKLVMMIS